MHFLRSITSFAACAALALPIQAAVLRTQDMMAMQEAFDKIFTQLDYMTGSFASLSADQAGLTKFSVDNSKLREVIVAGTQKVKSSPSISLMEVINIGGPLFVMENKVTEWVESLKSKKAGLDQVGGSVTVVDELKKDRAAVNALVAAIGQNLPIPALLSMIAGPIGDMIVGKLDASIKDWSPK
jgi:hypothetical protein